MASSPAPRVELRQGSTVLGDLHMTEPKKLTEARVIVATAYRRFAVALATANLTDEGVFDALVNDDAGLQILAEKHVPGTVLKAVERASLVMQEWPEALLEPEEIQFLRHLVRQAVQSAQAASSQQQVPHQ